MKKNILWLAAFILVACTQEEMPVLDASHSLTNTKAYGDGECHATVSQLSVYKSPYSGAISIDWDICSGVGAGINGETHSHIYDIEVRGRYKDKQLNVRPPYSIPSYYTLDRGDGIMVKVTDKIYGKTGEKSISKFFSIIGGDNGTEHKEPCRNKLHVKGNYYYDRGRGTMIVDVNDDIRSHGNKLQASIWTRSGSGRKCIKSNEMKDGHTRFELGVVSLASYDSLHYTIRIQALDHTCTMDYPDISVLHYASANFEGVEGYSGTLQFAEVSKVGYRSDW